jgi:hypothetical protein
MMFITHINELPASYQHDGTKKEKGLLNLRTLFLIFYLITFPRRKEALSSLCVANLQINI